MRTVSLTMGVVFGILLIGGAYLGLADINNKNETRVYSHPQFEDISWEGLINEDADIIVIGKVKSKGDRKEAVRLEDEDGDIVLYSHEYTIETKKKIKGKNEIRELNIEVLEDQDYGIQKNDEIFIIAKQLDGENVFVPVAGKHGLFKIENGKVKGNFIDKKQNELPLDALVDDIEKKLKQ